MAEPIVRLRLDSAEYDRNIKSARDGLLAMEQECRKYEGTLEVVEKEQLKYVQSLGKMETSSQSLKTKIGELTNAYSDLKSMYNRLTDAEKQSPFGKAMSQSLDQLKGRINDAKSELSQINEEFKDQQGILDTLANKIGVSTTKMLSFGTALAGGQIALTVAKDAFFSSETNIDEWGRTVESAKGAYDVFLQTLNNGSWDNFFSNLSTAVQGSRDLYDSLDRLNSINANNKAAIAIQQSLIQELRVKKQSATGAEADSINAQLKEAEATLKELRSQGIIAGKQYGLNQLKTTLQNGTAIEISDNKLENAANYLLNKGQSAFDFYKNKYAELKNKYYEEGTVTSSRSITGATQTITQGFVNVNAMSPGERQLYEIAKAITQRKSTLKAGIDIYSQAVNSERSSFQESYRNNSYILRGSSLAKTGASATKAEKEIYPNIAVGEGGMTANVIKDIMSNLQSQLNSSEIGSAVWQSLSQQLQDTQVFQNALMSALEYGLDTSMFEDLWEKIFNQESVDGALLPLIAHLNEELATIGAGVEIDSLGNVGKTVADAGKETKESWKGVASAMSQVGSAMSKIEDPAAKVAGILAQAVATMILSYTTAASQAAALGPIVWAGFAASGLAQVLAIVSSIKSAGAFADGGMIGGNSWSGDNMIANVNSGELILNRAQQGNLASQLEDSRNNAGNSQPFVTGETLWLGLNNYTQRLGYGEIVTTRQL